jgi:hypothetical protein
MPIGNVHVDVRGISKKGVNPDDIIAYCGRATRRDKEGVGKKGLQFIQVSINPVKLHNIDTFKVKEYDVYGFQTAFLNIDGGKTAYVTLDINEDGEATITNTVFKSTNLGEYIARIPDTKFNREMIIKSMALDTEISDFARKINPSYDGDSYDGMFLVAPELKEELKPVAEKIRKQKLALDKKIKDEATASAEKIEAVLIKNLKEKYGNGYRSMKEYIEVIAPLEKQFAKKLRAEYANGKVPAPELEGVSTETQPQ